MEYLKNQQLPQERQPTLEEIYARGVLQELGIQGHDYLICPDNGFSIQAAEVFGQELFYRLNNIRARSEEDLGFTPNTLDELFILQDRVHERLGKFEQIPEGTFEGTYALPESSEYQAEEYGLSSPEKTKVKKSIFTAHKPSSDSGLSIHEQTDTIQQVQTEEPVKKSYGEPWSYSDPKWKVPRGPGRHKQKQLDTQGTIFARNGVSTMFTMK